MALIPDSTSRLLTDPNSVAAYVGPPAIGPVGSISAAFAGLFLLSAGVLASLKQHSYWSRCIVLWMWGFSVMGIGWLMPWIAKKIEGSDEMKQMLKETAPDRIRRRCSKLPSGLPKIALFITLCGAAFRLMQAILWLHEGSPGTLIIRTELLREDVQTLLMWIQYWAVLITGLLINWPFYSFIFELSRARVNTYISKVPAYTEEGQEVGADQHLWVELTAGYMQLRDDLHNFWRPTCGGMYVVVPCVVLFIVGGFCGVSILVYPNNMFAFTVGMVVSVGLVVCLIRPLACVSRLCLSRSKTTPGIWASMEGWVGARMPSDAKISQMRLLQVLDTHKAGIDFFGVLVTDELMNSMILNVAVKLPSVLNVVGWLLNPHKHPHKPGP